MKQHKTTGIGIATLLVLGIVFMTIAQEKKPSTASMVSDATVTAADTTMVPPADNQKTVQLPPPTKSSSLFSFFGDDEGRDGGSDEESEGGSVSTASNTVTPTSTKPSATTPAATASGYKNGTYAVIASYMSPGGMDKLGVSITLSGGAVTASTVTPEAGNGTSSHYENNFAASYKSLVIGKNIANLSISKVAGASLTTDSFNQALANIRTQAKA